MSDAPHVLPLEFESNDEAVYQVIYQYGMAMYLIQVLEHQIVNLIVASRLPGKGEMTREQIRRFREDTFRKMMSKLLQDLMDCVDLPEELRERVSEIILKRNHLAHRFFREHHPDMQSVEGNTRLINELMALQKSVVAVDEELTELERSVWRARGMKYPF